MDMNLGKLREIVRNRDAWHAAIHGLQIGRHDWATEQQQQSAPLTFGSKPTHLAFLVDKKVTVSYLQIYFFQPSLAGSSASQFLMYW